MCLTCGCSDGGEITLTAAPSIPTGEIHEHTHLLPDGTILTHTHHHHPDGHQQDRSHNHHRTTLTVEQKLLTKNDRIAARNRAWFRERNILSLNLVSSPGSGKTTLLVRTLRDLQHRIPISVIEGDQATVNDARRIQETGCPAVQINTGTGCHLEAAMVGQGLQALQPPAHSIVMIENVGNLVCPALFDLGEQYKVVLLSVTEGEDKPIKYPHMFRAAQVMILNKIDLLPYVSFDLDRCLDYAYQVNPHLQIFQVSATTGTGLENWYRWLEQGVGYRV
jgi:hydrogenase nickel incorporation protein HypB